jgi:hypothetical protein
MQKPSAKEPKRQLDWPQLSENARRREKRPKQKRGSDNDSWKSNELRENDSLRRLEGALRKPRQRLPRRLEGRKKNAFAN